MTAMHEIGIVRQILRTVSDFAVANNVRDIKEVVVDCGELSLIIPKYLEEIYPSVVKNGSLKDAKLKINIMPSMAECNSCDEIFNVIEHKGYCPSCGSFDKTVLSGKDFIIREIVVQDQTQN